MFDYVFIIFVIIGGIWVRMLAVLFFSFILFFLHPAKTLS